MHLRVNVRVRVGEVRPSKAAYQKPRSRQLLNMRDVNPAELYHRFRVMRPYGLSLRAWILVLISVGVSISIAAWLARTVNYSHIGYIGSVMTKAHHEAQDLPVGT